MNNVDICLGFYTAFSISYLFQQVVVMYSLDMMLWLDFRHIILDFEIMLPYFVLLCMVK
jgi:hypothetical protein